MRNTQQKEKESFSRYEVLSILCKILLSHLPGNWERWASEGWRRRPH
jgi:hypothetical protein